MCLTEALQDISNWLTYFHYIFFIKIFLDFIFKNQFFSAAYCILHNILDKTWTFFFFYLSQFLYTSFLRRQFITQYQRYSQVFTKINFCRIVKTTFRWEIELSDLKPFFYFFPSWNLCFVRSAVRIVWTDYPLYYKSMIIKLFDYWHDGGSSIKQQSFE